MPALLSRPLLLFRRICWSGVFIWVVTVFTLSSLSGQQVEDLNVFNAWDKLLHFTAFCCGAFPLVPALRLSREWSWKRILLVAALSLSLYGAFDEGHQYFTPSRSALDPGDWLADTLGAVTGTLLTAFVYVQFTRTPRSAPARD